MTEPHRKFAFDTEFDHAGDIAYSPPTPKRIFNAAEVAEIKALAFAEGERSAVVRAEEAAALALGEIGRGAGAALGALARVAHEHRAACAELALAVGRTIAGAALERFPAAPAMAALQVLAREIEVTPRLSVRTAADLVDRLQAALDQTAQAIGFPGQILVKSDPALPAAAFVLDWGDGRASFDPVEAAERAANALRAALAAEGLHAEPLLPSNPGET